MHFSATVFQVIRGEVLLVVLLGGAAASAAEATPRTSPPRTSITNGRAVLMTTSDSPRPHAAAAGPALIGRLQSAQREPEPLGLSPGEPALLQPVPGDASEESSSSKRPGEPAASGKPALSEPPASNGPQQPAGPALGAPAAADEPTTPDKNNGSGEPTKPNEPVKTPPEGRSPSQGKTDGDSNEQSSNERKPEGSGTKEADDKKSGTTSDTKPDGKASDQQPAEGAKPKQPGADEPKPNGPEAKDKPEEAGEASVGEPLAAGMLAIMRQEIESGLKNRGVAAKYLRFEQYAASRLDATAGRYTGSELTGNCRLRWYDYLLRHPLEAPAEAEKFTRELHKNVLADHHGLARALAMVAPRMDLPRREPAVFPPITSPQQALDAVKSALVDTQALFAAALGPLSRSEIRELQTSLVPVMVTQNRVGHTLQDRGTGRRMCDLLEKMDRDAVWACAERLVVLTDPELLKQLRQLPDDAKLTVDGVTGPLVARISTPAGAILIGGKGSNVYQLDRLADVACVIDLGGNDGYVDGTTSLQRPVLVLIDLDGNDIYRSTKPGVQGAAVLGVSMVLDLAGDDKYQAQDVAQGSAIGGVGILIDYAGNDEYLGLRRVQGHALGGVGLLIDRGGHDDYRAAMWAQGFGAPLGFGLLDDVEGDDHYFSGGQWPDSYEETPGLEGWGQGVGAGIRQVANGGIGVILDGSGDDVYEFDYLSHGGGYWCGVGFARDFGGNDQRLITRTSYARGGRTEPKFQRFGCGWGCHYAVGFCIDDAGNDVYEGTIMGTGMAWDCAIGFLFDFGGDDRYEAAGGLTQGTGAQASLGVLFDYNGDDNYRGYGQGYASPSITYHDMPGCGGNFSFCIDYGGKDTYGCGAKNNSYIQRGADGGFLIDRPRRDEVTESAPNTVAGATNK